LPVVWKVYARICGKGFCLREGFGDTIARTLFSFKVLRLAVLCGSAK
jgi:hypothetical protein